jgi:hypothetical protein
MQNTREAIMTALFAQVVGAYAFRTVGRRLQLWKETPDQPALFLRNAGDHYPARAVRGLPAKVTIEAEIWLYVRVGPDKSAIPGAALNALIDAVEMALQPGPAQEVQTLGGLVQHCWIEGKIEMDPGDLDGQAKAIIPVRMLAL